MSRDRGEADAIAERLHDAVERFNETGERPYRLRLSVGTSRFDPATPVPVDQLLDHADRQMYLEKQDKQSLRRVSVGRST